MYSDGLWKMDLCESTVCETVKDVDNWTSECELYCVFHMILCW